MSMMDFIDDNLGWVIVGLFAIFLPLGIWACLAEQKEWDSYAQVHHCRAVGQKAASNGFGTGSKGEMVVTYNPSQTVYQCDGGEIQIR